MTQHYFGFISPLERTFRNFHDKNPEVYAELVAHALKLKRAGRDVYGINSLIEVVRWHRNIQTRGDEFKINNNYAPFYSRLIMQKEPRLDGFFNLRKQRVQSTF
jgi:hypothetical protein